MKATTIKYRVAPLRESGKGTLPFDMLRYDGAHPASETDSAIMEARMLGGTGDARPVELVAHYSGAPNDARWRSFNWHVTHVWTGYEWENYTAAYRAHRLTK